MCVIFLPYVEIQSCKVLHDNSTISRLFQPKLFMNFLSHPGPLLRKFSYNATNYKTFKEN